MLVWCSMAAARASRWNRSSWLGSRQAVLRQDLERDVPAQALLHRLVDDAHAAAGDLAQDAVVAQPLGDRPRGLRPRREQPGRLVGPAAELFNRDQGREQLVDLRGELGVFLGVVAQGRPLAAAVPLGKFVGQHVEQVGARGRRAHGDDSAHPPRLGKDLFEPSKGPHVAHAGRLFLDVENRGSLGHGELLEVPQGQHLAIDRVHGIERRLELDLSLGPDGRFARAGRVSQQLRGQGRRGRPRQ